MSDISGRRGPLCCEGLISQCKGMPGPGRGSGWVGEQEERGWDKEFWEGKPGKEITF